MTARVSAELRKSAELAGQEFVSLRARAHQLVGEALDLSAPIYDNTLHVAAASDTWQARVRLEQILRGLAELTSSVDVEIDGTRVRVWNGRLYEVRIQVVADADATDDLADRVAVTS